MKLRKMENAMLHKIVRVVNKSQRILNPEMIQWIEDHKDSKFYVEKVCDTSAKLSKVNFWITFDLLEEV